MGSSPSHKSEFLFIGNSDCSESDFNDKIVLSSKIKEIKIDYVVR